ncbi:MAG: hypothetical protein WA738_13310 [Candidatus Angelobacter sp.]
MKKALLIALVAVLLAPHLFAQTPASSEANRIVGARLDIEYNADKTMATVHVMNISNKVIATVRVSYVREGGSVGTAISGAGNLKPGESFMEMTSGSRITEVNLDAIVYADGSIETRNETVAAKLKEEERLAKEQNAKELEYARAFAVPDPALHMPQEEQIVRKYYGKLSFLSQIAVLSDIIKHGQPKLTDAAARKLIKDSVRFELSEFQTGDFAEIETRPWTLLLNPDALQGVIQVSSASANIGIDKQSFLLTWYQTTWNKVQQQPEQQQERREQLSSGIRFAGVSTVKDVVRVTHSGEWSRYASFSVRATLAGQAISYRATFLFAHQGETVAIFDPAMSMPVGLNAPLYPTVLVESVYRELSFFKRWVADHQLNGCKKLKEPEVCCDPATGQCGLSSEDVARSLSLPIDDKERWLLKGLMDSSPILATQSDAPCPVTVAGTKK